MAIKKGRSIIKYFVIPSVLALILLAFLLISSKSFFRERSKATIQNKQKAASYMKYSNDKRDNVVSEISNDYLIEKIDEEWGLVVSDGMNFQIKIPHDATVNKGGGLVGFGENRMEMAQLGINLNTSRDVSKRGNAVIVIETGLNPFSDAKEAIIKIALEDYYNGGGFVSPASGSNVVQSKLGNANGYELYQTTNIEKLGYKYNFITVHDKYFIRVWYFYPWAGTELTSNEEKIVKEVVSSFRLLIKQ